MTMGRFQLFFLMWGVGVLSAGLAVRFGLYPAILIVTGWAAGLALAHRLVGRLIDGR
jgi:hypothetical protein